ncbi:helix-turn-helix domain-containing protein [Microcoleus sp. Pol11C1]|uniref:helix-turn-helix domain-containing protein n=1 Tax=unclassified Microcoleus TaxID=2642155 RepID=UPI002FD1E5B0
MSDKLRALYEQGKTIHQLADFFEVSPTCIYNRLKKADTPMRIVGHAHLSTSGARDARRAQIGQMKAQGMNNNQIAKIVGVSRSTVRSYLRTLNKSL